MSQESRNRHQLSPQKNQASLPEPSQPPPIISFKYMNNNIYLNLNISSYYINQLASPYISTWHTAGGPITQKTKHLDLNKHHIRTVEITWKMVNDCKEKGAQYTGGEYSIHVGGPYVLKYSYELNILSS